MTLATLIPQPTDVSIDGIDVSRDTWLTLRRNSIGASDAAAVLGRSPHRTPLQLYMDKLGLLPDEPETPEQRRGRRLEPLAIEDYQETTGTVIERKQLFVRHPKYPFITATLDGVRSDGRPVEIKTVHPFAMRQWGDEGTDAVPEHILIQCQHQLLVTGQPVLDVAALFGGQTFKIFPIEANADIAEVLIERENDFWANVLTRTPPAPTGDDAEVMARLYPQAFGEVDLGRFENADVAAERWQALGKEIRQLEAERAEAKALLLAIMGEARFGKLPDGRILKRSIVEVKAATIERKASTQVRLTFTKGSDDE